MELHQLHSEPKESGHCDIDYRMDAALQGNILVSSLSLQAQASSVVIAAAGIIHGAAHGCLSLACLVGYGVYAVAGTSAACTLCASLPRFLTLAQGGRFVLVSAAALGLMRGCDSLTTSDLCVSSCCTKFFVVTLL